MVKRFTILTVLALMMSFAAVTVYAQDTIEYGEIVTGEITDDETEISYTLAVEEGDIVVLDMRRTKDSELYSTAVIVQDPDGDEVLNTTEDTSASNTVAGFVADESGDFTVIATRNQYSETTGEFELRPTSARLLESGDDVKGLVDNESADVYYALPYDTDVSVSYIQTSGDYYLYFRIYSIDNQNSASLYASSTAIDGITWTVTFTTEADYLTLVSVGADEYDFQYEDISSKFTLTVE
ncbi:MAG: hypothetical protein LCI00_22890 [Chloroflexi bacterium]|nr:hypothetical protein [Chloroflexota bacterium]MCC6895901.1 hypothetical protein [Anaerolineae bacterium]